MNHASTMGTIISETHLRRIEMMVEERPVKARILAGGKRLQGESALDGFDFSQGLFYPPTVIDGVETHDGLWREEVFGPVVVVKKFKVSQSLSPPPLRHDLLTVGCTGGSRRHIFGQREQVRSRGSLVVTGHRQSSPSCCRDRDWFGLGQHPSPERPELAVGWYERERHREGERNRSSPVLSAMCSSTVRSPSSQLRSL